MTSLLAGDDDDVTEETALLLNQQVRHDQNKIRNQGGLSKKMPKRGYCLVFNKELKDKYNVYKGKEQDKNEETLMMTKKRKNKDDKEVNLLRHFVECNIKYYIQETKNNFFVIIFMDDQILEEWADLIDYEVPINPPYAIKKGREISNEFDLAHHTFCPGVDEDKIFSLAGIDEKFEKLDTRKWDYIHIPFDTSIDRNIYELPVLNDHLYLNLLYDVLTNDYKLGGAQFVTENRISSKRRPLICIFALHDYESGVDKDGDGKRDITLSNIYNWQFFKPSTWFGVVEDNKDNGIIDEIRDYYGEHIAFYFLFTVHYIRALYPMIIIGVIWFIAQMIYGSIAVPGSTIGVLLSIIWTTIMLEYYYRLEWDWRYKWGMTRYSDTEVPQPTFKGRYLVSPESGMVVEDYKSWYIHFCKIGCSVSTMFFCIAIVIGCVFTIWFFKDRLKDDTQYSILIGVINSIEIQITNALYTKLAIYLNGWENHRLKLDYYNHLVVKRICFIVINSFNSLFYIAFYESGFETKEDRLNAVRIQLLTLFFTAIVIQNTMEIGIPWFTHWVKIKLKQRKQQKMQEEEKQLLLNSGGDVERGGSGGVDEEEYAEEFKSNEENEIDEIIYKDIKDQMTRQATPSLLDNTAEVVVLHGYIVLFVVVFPLMPLLALINNYFEIGIDYYNLLHSQRPVPYSSNGIGVWKTVISIFNIIAVFSNIALLTFRTSLIVSLVGDSEIRLLIWYFILCIVLVGAQLIIRGAIDDKSPQVKNAMKRQEQCEKFLIRNPVKTLKKSKDNQQSSAQQTEQ